MFDWLKPVRPAIKALVQSLTTNPGGWEIDSEHNANSLDWTSVRSRTDYKKDGAKAIVFRIYAKEVMGVELNSRERRLLAGAVLAAQIANALGQPTADGKVSICA